MIAVLVGQPCPKTSHTAPQPTLEEAFAERSLSRHRFLPTLFFFVAADWASTRTDATFAYRIADVVHGASAAQGRVI